MFARGALPRGGHPARSHRRRLYAGAMADSDIAFAALDRDGGERFQSLRRQLDVRSFGMNVVVLQPRQRGRIHAHEGQEEVYLVLEGELTLLVEGVDHVLAPDHLVRVGPAVRRQLVNTGPHPSSCSPSADPATTTAETAAPGPRGMTTGQAHHLKRFRCRTTYRPPERQPDRLPHPVDH
jgi:mannose-6-phosphate isomerase-like protein (cupin superfamily)